VADEAPRGWPARIEEAAWLAAAAGVPLAFNPWGANPFELPKALLLRGLVLAMGLAALAGAAGGEARRARLPAALLWPALGCGLAAALSTVASVDPPISLWGSYERQQGLLALAAGLALFLLAGTGLRTRGQVDQLLAVLAWGSLPVAGYALLQAAGLDAWTWRSDAASPLLSTLGRSNFLGSYLALVVPLAAGRLALAGRRWPYALLLAAQGLALVLTRARGAYAGLVAAALAGLLAWALSTRDRRPALVALALLAGLVLVLGVSGGPGRAALFDPDAGSTAARLTIWRAGLPLAAARPALGYGPETLRAVFAGVYPPELVYYQGRAVAVDRAHNLWLDLALASGAAGVLAWAALLAGWAGLAWRGLRTAGDHRARVTWTALAAGVAGHLVELQAGFELTAGATLFWLLLAVSAALGRESAGAAAPREPARERPGRLVYVPLAVAGLLLGGQVCLRPLLADAASWQGQRAAWPLEARLAAAERAVRLWPLEPAYRLGLARVYEAAGRRADAEAQMAAAAARRPGDPAVWAACGALYARWGAVEPGRTVQAEAAYRHAVALAPNVAGYHTALGLALAAQGRAPEATAELERAVALDATDGAAYGHLAALYRLQGRLARAAQAERQARYWMHKAAATR
jgi:putative inorganic carbon (HCO3(-)) transporter